MDTYEKKYKEAQKWIESIYPNLSHEQQMEAEAFFPELAESEDEKVRKGLINGFKQCVKDSLYPKNAQKYWHNIKIEDILAWLEKQGEEKVQAKSLWHEYNHPIDKDRLFLLISKNKRASIMLWNGESLKSVTFGGGGGIILEGDKFAYIDELREIQDIAWSEEDKKLTDVNHEYFSELLENNNSKDINDYAYQVAYCMSHDWANETPTWDNVQKACKLGAEWNEKHHKSTWSEEDENILKSIHNSIDVECLLKNGVEYLGMVYWLKSLKDRVQPQNTWKPSDEQMEALWNTLHPDDPFYVDLSSLYNDLKKLTEE